MQQHQQLQQRRGAYEEARGDALTHINDFVELLQSLRKAASVSARSACAHACVHASETNSAKQPAASQFWR
jgi:hypothetical protein